MTIRRDGKPMGLVAIRGEAAPLVACLDQEGKTSERVGDATLYTGRIGGRPAAIASALVGPVHGALAAQALVLRHSPGCLISFGSAGALDPALAVGDVVIARRAVPHDAGAFMPSGFVPVGVSGRHRQGWTGTRRAFMADPELVADALRAAQSLKMAVQTGTMVTGNQTILSTVRARWLRETFDAVAVEMETAAVAQVAAAYNLPWVGVRAISDHAGDESLDIRRLFLYIDGGGPRWRQSIRRLLYVLTRPRVRRQVAKLRRGLVLAAARAARVVEVMLQE